ncbi:MULTISPECIES: hypothetical protein [unclassified Allomuricauda]|uniref:hypothetical protein n=2 Tax=Allomuricauda TaxID=111500 RepID=UPI00273FE987|nr:MULTISPECIES: hypothetical protein [unclassified Allomuricauda]
MIRFLIFDFLGFQEFINNLFGIENEVSAPILITLLVFVVSGIVKLMFNQIKRDRERGDYRKNFIVLIEEIIKDCKVRENSTFNLLPLLNSSYQGYWPFDYLKIRYINTFFDLPFEKVFDSFKSKIRFRCNQKLRRRAFHEVYSTLENLKYFDSLIYPDFKAFIADLNKYHEKYNESISQFNYLRDGLALQYKEEVFTEGAGVLDDFVVESNNIWKKWMALEENDRLHYKNTYDYLIKPSLELNRKNKELDFTLDLNKYLLECSAYYAEMENIILRSKLTLKYHYLNYRLSRRILKKCLEILD